ERSKPDKVAVTVKTTKGTPSTAWAMITPGKVATRLNRVKKKNMPAATIIRGTIIGASNSAVMGRRQGMSGLDNPKAATVPKTVAIAVELSPITRLFRIAMSQMLLSNTALYHFVE